MVVMASPLHSRKSTVDLAAPVVKVSRIRRDPPPPVKEITAADIREADGRSVAIGVTTIALAIFVILIAVSNAAGWSPSQYTIRIED
jgi:hypothetical protein